MSKKKRQPEQQPQPQPEAQPQPRFMIQNRGILSVEELSENDARQLIEKPLDEYTRTAIEMINTLIESEKPLKFTISHDLDFDKLLRKLDYRVRKFNKRNIEFKIIYRADPINRQIVMLKMQK